MHTTEKELILIVDDNPNNLEVIFNILTQSGFEIAVAVNGESALEQVKEDPPDLILLDILMPGINGFETCKHLKSDPLTHDIPIIFMTALDDVVDKVKGLSLGAVDYISKPFAEEEVLARVRVHLKLRSLMKALEAQNIRLKQEIKQRELAEAAMHKAIHELERFASIDALTEVANRRRFDLYLDQEWQRMEREQRSLSLIVCDIDYFKDYNDTYGHLAGDFCLHTIAQAINRALKRPSDLVARFGGEEFAVILPDTDIDGAVFVAERIRESVQKLQIVHIQSSVSEFVTLSLGVASLFPSAEVSSQVLIDLADRALYTAKREGRNCVRSFGNSETL